MKGLLLGLAAWVASAVASEPVTLGPWEIRHPYPTSAATGIAHDGGKYVLVDGFGHVFTSVSGKNWTLQPGSPMKPLLSVGWGRTNFVSVGEAGVIVRSSDGTNWVEAASGVTNGLNVVAFVDGRFVVGGSDGLILTSADGVEFGREQTLSAEDIYNIAAHDGTLVAAGPSTVLVSTNGGEWKSALVTTTNLFRSVTWFDGKWHNGWYGTADPMVWTNKVGTTGRSNVVSLAARTNGLVRAVGGRIEMSANGTNWVPDRRFATRIYRATTIADRFHLVGGGAVIFGDATNGLRPMHLQAYEEDNRVYFRSVAGDTNGVVALDTSGRSYYSADAQGWRLRTESDPMVNTNDIGFATAPFARKHPFLNQAEVSEDGETWERLNGPSGMLYAAAAIGEAIVVAGMSNIWVTTNRSTWKVVATKQGRPIPMSEGGSAEWTPYEPWIYGMVAGHGLVAAVTGWGEILLSRDGFEWQTMMTPFQFLQDAAFTADGILVCSFGMIAEARFDGQRPATSAPRFEISDGLIRFAGPLRYHEVEASEDFLNWSVVAGTSSNAFFAVPLEGSKFYRAVRPH